MKANELMIGDWVQVPSELNRPKRIRSTFDMDSAVLYKPIPLTPEILEKNGFVKKEHRWILSDPYTNDELIVLLNVAKGFALPTAEGMTLGFQYVHELQHFYKLCGINKEIIL